MWLCSLALVLVVGQASASPITFTLSLTNTAGGATLVGEPDSVLSLDFAGTAGTFFKLDDTLTPTIFDDILTGTRIVGDLKSNLKANQCGAFSEEPFVQRERFAQRLN
jgi:hypothetical protein